MSVPRDREPGAPGPHSNDPLVQAVVGYFESLSPASLDALATVYAADARFKDPFNDVRGLPAIRRIYAHMFDTLEAPRFVVCSSVAEGGSAFLVWDFHFRRRGQPRAWTLHGATRLRFDAQGRIAEHRDYWDVAEELYARLPLIGPLMRWLARRLAVPQR